MRVNLFAKLKEAQEIRLETSKYDLMWVILSILVNRELTWQQLSALNSTMLSSMPTDCHPSSSIITNFGTGFKAADQNGYMDRSMILSQGQRLLSTSQDLV
uniref:Uncharacterized protein n=1 Tax=Noccaea caerulescens TaxID=107243 RepID=A0A1J3K914_NOCCA